MPDFSDPAGVATKSFGRFSSKLRKRTHLAVSGLMLTSMLDILVTVLFFLLKNYADLSATYSVAKDIKLPNSTILTPPPSSVLSLVVTKNALILDELKLFDLRNLDIPREELLSDGVTIKKLAQALAQHKKRSLYIEKMNDSHSFTGTIVLEADKNLQFGLLKKVLYTTGVTDFVNLKLAVLKGDRG